MYNFGKSTKRAERRAWLANVRRKARLKAEREYRRDLISRRPIVPFSSRPIPLWYYIRFMKSDAHWLNGGCSKVRCGICRARGLADKLLRDGKRTDEDLFEWFTRPWDEI